MSIARIRIPLSIFILSLTQMRARILMRASFLERLVMLAAVMLQRAGRLFADTKRLRVRWRKLSTSFQVFLWVINL
jgi:hypothetical protein